MAAEVKSNSSTTSSSEGSVRPARTIVSWKGKKYELTQEKGPLFVKPELDTIVEHSLMPFLNALGKAALSPDEIQRMEISFGAKGEVTSFQTAKTENESLAPVDRAKFEKCLQDKTASQIAHKVGSVFREATLRMTHSGAPAKKPKAVPLNIDVAGDGACAAHALTYAMTGKLITDKKDNKDTSNRLRKETVEYLKNNAKNIANQGEPVGLMQAIRTAMLDAEARQEGDRLFNSDLEKDLATLSKQEKLVLIKEYASYITPNRIYLDTPFFIIQSLVQRKPIILVQGRGITAVLPHSMKIRKEDCHFVYFTGGEHYNAVNKSSPRLDQMIEDYNTAFAQKTSLELFLETPPTQQTAEQLEKNNLHAYLAICSLVETPNLNQLQDANQPLPLSDMLTNKGIRLNAVLARIGATVLSEDGKELRLTQAQRDRLQAGQALNTIITELFKDPANGNATVKTALETLSRVDLSAFYKMAGMAFRKERLSRNARNFQGINNRGEFPLTCSTVKEGLSLEELKEQFDALARDPIKALKHENDTEATFRAKMALIFIGTDSIRDQKGRETDKIVKMYFPTKQPASQMEEKKEK